MTCFFSDKLTISITPFKTKMRDTVASAKYIRIITRNPNQVNIFSKALLYKNNQIILVSGKALINNMKRVLIEITIVHLINPLLLLKAKINNNIEYQISFLEISTIM